MDTASLNQIKMSVRLKLLNILFVDNIKLQALKIKEDK